MKVLCLDIETIPSVSLPAECIPLFDPESVRLGNIKDPVKIKEKIEEERKKFTDGLSKQMSLDPAFAQLCTIVALICDSETGQVSEAEGISLQLSEKDNHDDLDLVQGAWNIIQVSYRQRIPLVTFNGISFDLPILLFRAIKQDIPIDRVMWQRLTTKWDNPFHYDLMQTLANWQRERWHSLEFYLKLFQIGKKEDFDGSMVYDAYKRGEYAKIQAYCRKEVVEMCGLFMRVEPWIKVPFKQGGEL